MRGVKLRFASASETGIDQLRTVFQRTRPQRWSSWWSGAGNQIQCSGQHLKVPYNHYFLICIPDSLKYQWLLWHQHLVIYFFMTIFTRFTTFWLYLPNKRVSDWFWNVPIISADILFSFFSEGYDFFFPFYMRELEPLVDKDVCHLLVNAFP